MRFLLTTLLFAFFLSFTIAAPEIHIYEGIALADRLKIIKAAEDFIEGVEKTLARSIDDIITSEKDSLSLDIKKIDPNSQSTEAAVVITKPNNDPLSTSFLFAPLVSLSEV